MIKVTITFEGPSNEMPAFLRTLLDSNALRQGTPGNLDDGLQIKDQSSVEAQTPSAGLQPWIEEELKPQWEQFPQQAQSILEIIAYNPFSCRRAHVQSQLAPGLDLMQTLTPVHELQKRHPDRVPIYTFDKATQSYSMELSVANLILRACLHKLKMCLSMAIDDLNVSVFTQTAARWGAN